MMPSKSVRLKDFSKNFDSKMDVSHLCHLKSCIKVAHLNLETRSMNNKRKACVKVKKCYGHDPEPMCIF